VDPEREIERERERKEREKERERERERERKKERDMVGKRQQDRESAREKVSLQISTNAQNTAIAGAQSHVFRVCQRGDRPGRQGGRAAEKRRRDSSLGLRPRMRY
jgi:hypothetical protein